MEKHVLKIKPFSEAERYFKDTYIPICKDEVICRLGSDVGQNWNEYEITHEDYIRCQTVAKNKKRVC